MYNYVKTMDDLSERKKSFIETKEIRIEAAMKC